MSAEHNAGSEERKNQTQVISALMKMKLSQQSKLDNSVRVARQRC